jgi:methylenetetrahydrofolate reductase (NADPH)
MNAKTDIRASRFVKPEGAGHLRVSFEFFPPKTEERTHATVKRILAETSLTPAAHLTCVDATRDEVDSVIRSYWDAGVRHIVGLRGDATGGIGERYVPHPGGYANAADLVGGIKRLADFEVSVSAYPEKHPDSATVEADIDMLAAKVDAGATRAITQFFFDNDLYFRYLDRVRARGIVVPIVPGILPVLNIKQTKVFAERCGASVPAWIAKPSASKASTTIRRPAS